MSLEGKLEGNEIRGRISNINVLHTDAYEVALRNGFKGTIDEWLETLRGEKGESPVIRLLYGREPDGRNRVTIRVTNTDGVVYEAAVTDGTDGRTPEKGTDYWTEAEVAGIQAYIDEAAAKAFPDGRISELESAVEEIVAELNYKPIDITQFTVSEAGNHEIGSTIETVTITWELNKEPASQDLNGGLLGSDIRTTEYTDVSSNQKYTLSVTDERGATDSANASINFYNGVYYGYMADGAEINSAAILGMGQISTTPNHKLQNSRAVTFTANARSGFRHSYALPSRLGTPTFKDAETGFQAGFYKAATIAFTNKSGYTENYDVWLSTNPGLGSMTVTVS